MKISTIIKNGMVILASMGMIVPQMGTAYSAPPVAFATRPDQSAMTDVALNAEGKLVGQVVDHQGIARANRVVTITTSDGEIVQKGQTNDKGMFSIELKKGGVYVISGTATSTAVRVWTQAAAPPSANTGLMVVDDTQAVRGGLFRDENGDARWGVIGATGGLLLGGIIALAVTRNSGS